jgi:hypothetical protein
LASIPITEITYRIALICCWRQFTLAINVRQPGRR